MYRIFFFKRRRMQENTSVHFEYKQGTVPGKESCHSPAVHVWRSQIEATVLCLVSGPSVSGNSSFCTLFQHHPDPLCTNRIFHGGIIWCYSASSALVLRLQAAKRNVQFNEGVPAEFDKAQDRPCLIILDDLLNNVYSKDVCDLFTKGSHYRNISVNLITQNFFHQGRYCRDISFNVKSIVALKNVRNKNQFLHLRRQLCPEDSSGL
jgi:hypothetical protein